MSKQCLNIQQMQHLKEFGVDTSKASMCYVVYDSNTRKPILCINGDESDYLDDISYSLPAFTLQDILDLLPSEIECKEEPITYHIEIAFDGDGVWEISYTRNSHVLEYFYHENFIEVAYEMLCWCVENGYVETKK